MKDLSYYIQKVLAEEYNHRPWDGYWHCSQLSKCSRLLYLDSIGHLAPPVTNLKLLLTFKVGHFYHSLVQELWEKAGILKSKELVLTSEKYKVTGACDAVIDIIGYDECVEVKSLSQQYFNNEKYLEKHILQLLFYMWLSGNTKTGRVFYINKNNSDTKEFIVNYDHSIIEKTLNKLKYIEESQSLPIEYVSCTTKLEMFCFFNENCKKEGLLNKLKVKRNIELKEKFISEPNLIQVNDGKDLFSNFLEIGNEYI